MNSILDGFDASKCCGCESCVVTCPAGALTMGKDRYGFLVPQEGTAKCIGCAKCIKACPYHQLKEQPQHKTVYAAVCKSTEIQRQSSSGGIMGCIARHVLEQNGKVFGCEMDEDFQVRHVAVERLSELPRIQRSKYVQSRMGDTYRQVKACLRQGQRVLFTGTPCQTAGLKACLGRLADDEHLLTIDIVCHGVPSQDFFNDYLDTLARHYGEPVRRYTFRAKRRIRNGMEWNVSYETLHKKCFRNWPEDSFNYYYMKGATYRDSCYHCPFASPVRYSDITLCDYWHWQDCGLHFHEDDSVSGIVLNTAKGAAVFNEVKDELVCEASSFQQLAAHNSCLHSPTPPHSQRDSLLATWKEKGYAAIDVQFREKYKAQILKYRVMRHIPRSIIRFVHKHL